MMDILQSVDRFIEHRMYHYALLINGKWGCGKTFFIQKTLIPFLREKGHDVNYLSLYGVRSTDEISHMLCMQAIKDKFGKAGKVVESKGGQIGTVLFSAVTKIGLGKIGAEDLRIDEIISSLPNYDNNVIIFDDLERCGCDISEVLGYINNFVEHSDASIILVANEEEIGEWQLDNNPEIQMLLALDKRIDVAVEPTKEEYIRDLIRGTQEKKPRETYTLEQLEQRRRIIFQTNERYKRIKEKVIGQTIQYEPDLKEVLWAIVDKKTEGVLRDTLLLMIEEFVSVAEKEKHANLRTFQFFLEKASIIFSSIAIKKKYESVFRTILLYCYRSCVRYMKGQEMPVWDGDYGEQSFDGNGFFSTNIVGFKFIDELIVNNEYDEAHVLKTLDHFIKLAEEKGQFTNDPYQLVKEWYFASDEELEKWLVEIENNIKAGRYSTELFSGILNTIAKLISYDVMADNCGQIFDAMKTYIVTVDPAKLEDLEYEHFLPEGDAGKIYKQLRTELEEIMKDRKKLSEKRIFEEALAKDNWGTELLSLANIEGTLRGHSFIFWLEPSSIVHKVSMTRNNKELQQFRFAMQCYYDGRVYYEAKTDDIEHLQEIQSLLKSSDMENCGQIKRQYYDWIICDIERYLNKMMPVEVEQKES